MSTGRPQGQASPGAEETFGACLGRLLEEKGWSVAALAEALSIERSLVYKWQRNERAPQLHTDYVEQIATLLKLSAAERTALEASQVRSLRAQRPQTPRSRATHVEVHRVLSYTPGADVPPGSSDGGNEDALWLADLETQRLGGSGAARRAIRGRADIMRETLAMIDRAPAPRDLHKNTILVSTFAQAHWTQAEDYYHPWQEALRRACARGWRICHVWRLTRDVRRSIGIVRTVLGLVGTGQYSALQVTPYEPLRPAYDLLIIPGVGAMEYLGVEGGTGLDGALVLRDHEQIELLRAHFQQIVAQARPLLQVYLTEDEQPALAREIAQAYEANAGRALVKDGLSFVTEPAAWTREDSSWARRTGRVGAELATLIELRRRRLAAFERHVHTTPYRDVCPMRAVRDLVEAGRYQRTAAVTARPILPASREERIEHLENAIALLRAHERYELALVDEHEEQDMAVLPGRYWEVVGGERVFTTMRVLDAQRRSVNAGVMIVEPTVVGAFQQYFEDLWARIPPRNRDKEYVQWWLARQLDRLRDAKPPSS